MNGENDVCSAHLCGNTDEILKFTGEFMDAKNDGMVVITRERNHGIDLLRIVSMFMVVMLHVLGQGGILARAVNLTWNGEIWWSIEILCYCAVNVYALISGYVGLKSRHKYSNLINLCIQLTFYAVIIGSTEAIVLACKGEEILFEEIIFHFFPSIRSMWYFQAYFCLFFFMPLLNAIIENVPRKILCACGWLVLIVFCCSGIWSSHVAHLGSGYSVLWLSILYAVGAYMNKYDTLKNISISYSLLGYFMCIFATVLSRSIIGTYDSSRINLFVSYISPTIVMSAVFLLSAFSKMKFGKKSTVAISYISPLSFGVYLIHCHPYIFNMIRGHFAWIADKPMYYALFIVVGVAMAIFVGCLIIEMLRYWLFKVCKIKEFCVWLENSIAKIVSKSKNVQNSDMPLKSEEGVASDKTDV